MEQLATKKESFRHLPSGLGELFSLGPKLADGPSSQLIEAEDRETGHRGLLKVLDSASFGVAERHRILREWTRQQKLVTGSDVVIAPLRCGQHDGVIWQFRNNIAGIPLDVVIQDGPLPMGDAIAIAAQVALGLAELHGEGFLHRDLKPEHILFRGRGNNGPRVALIDAGVSVRISTQTPYPIFGTVGYVSPEQIAGRLVSFRSDLYALGCILYEMLSGEQLFEGEDPVWVLQQHLGAPRPALPPGLPQAIKRLLSSLLGRSPRKRPLSAEQVFRTLSPFTDDGVRKRPSIIEGEGESMQRKIDLGVSDSEELRRATLLGLPSQPSRGKRPPPPPTETLPPPMMAVSPEEPSVPSAAALSGAAQKDETPVREELTTASVSTPPPINAPGYRSKAPVAKTFPAVNAPGYSSIAPSGLLDLNIPLEDLDYEDLEDTDAMKARHDVERDTAGTLVDIPLEAKVQAEVEEAVHRDPTGTAVLAFDEIEPMEDDDIVSASQAPAEIFDGVDEIDLDDVEDELVASAPEASASEVEESFESFEDTGEVLRDSQLDLPVATASASEPPVLPVTRIPARPSVQATLPMPTQAKAVPTQAKAVPTQAKAVPTQAKAVPTQAVRETTAAPKTNRAVWVAALLGAFVGTVVLGAVAWWVSSSQSSEQVATTPVSAQPAAVKPANAQPSTPAVLEEVPSTPARTANAEDVKILPVGEPKAEATNRKRTRSAARSQSPAPREAAPKPAAAKPAAAKPAAAKPAAAKPAAAKPAPVEPTPVSAAPAAAPAASPFDQIREQAKQAFNARRYQEAAALYERATTMNPRHAGSFSGLGASRLAQGDARGAALAYIKAVNLAPQNSRYFVNLGHSYLRAGDQANAKRAYEKALSINPNLKGAQTALQRLR